MADRVTYYFYTARVFLGEGDFSKAEARLEYALKHCHHESEANIQRILVFLVPLRMMLGKPPPTPELLERHFLATEFTDVIEALQLGDLTLFKKSIDVHEEFYAKHGIFLLVMKLKSLIYRQLFRRVWLLREKSAELHLSDFKVALKVSGEVRHLLGSGLELELV